MKRVFTTMLVSMFCYCAFAQLSIWYNGQVVYSRAYAEIDSITFGLAGTTPSTPTTPSDGSVYTAEQTKNKLMDVAKRMVDQFNTADQKAVIDLADQLFVKYKEYEWEEVGDHFADRYDPILRMPQYMRGVVQGTQAAAATDVLLAVSFPDESAIFEADDATRTWKYKGKASDNSMILRCKDKNGNTIEAKAWGEGTTKTYEYSWDEYDYPKVYVGSNFIYTEYYGKYRGSYHWFYKNESGWYYYDDAQQKTVNIDISEVTDITHAEGHVGSEEQYRYLYKDEANGKWYYRDWDQGRTEYLGKNTVQAVLPQKMHFTLKQGSTVLSQCDFAQEMVKNDHANFSVDCKLANLSWNVETKINSTYATAAFEFYYGSKKFLSAAANLPMYKLIGIENGQSYDEWIEQYEDRYEELLKAIGEADGICDLFGEVQIKGHIDNFGYAYRDYKEWYNKENYENRYTKAMVQQFCNVFNDHLTTGLYYNNDVKQAEFRFIANYDERFDDYSPEAVMYFPMDRTSYGFEQYFDRKPFTGDLKYMVEDLVNKYIQTSPSLYDEVGKIEL